jgi:rhodanese-related sulfurtransferase
MKFKNPLFRMISLVGAAYLGCAASATQASELEALRAKVRAKFPTVRQLPTSELATWLTGTNGPLPVLLDARTEEEFAVSHLPDAKQADSKLSTRDLVNRLGTNRAVVVYCSVGYRSSQMAERLQKAGLTNVFNLDGSIFQWANEGRPLEQSGKPAKMVHPYNDSMGKLLRQDIRANVSPAKN